MRNLLTIAFLFIQVLVFGQITIDVNTNFSHTVGGVDSFDRARMIQIHADIEEPDWDGWNFPGFADLRDSILNYYDITMGRNTGGISWQFSQVNEDPTRPGYADPAHLASRGQTVRNNYANKTNIHQYESRNSLVIATQQHPFFPDGTLTQQGWASVDGYAVGEFMGRYVNEFHGGNGQPKPVYVEVMNEPLYELVTEGNETPADVFTFHNEVADAFKQQSSLPIGGYVAAFPNFEVSDFGRWDDRMKLFMDMCGTRMDYWSVHFYDFNSFWNGGFALRRGSNMEATFDMIDHYSELSLNERKPYMISEYGGRSLNLETSPWTPLRDWSLIKSANSMLLSFTERPDMILSAIPFIPIKAEWGRQSDGDPYPWRLMRQNKEIAGQTGLYWEFTEMIKFYQLWHHVKGARVDAESTNPDIQSNAFVDGNKLYLVMNNLYFQDTTLHLNIENNYNNTIQNVRVKHLYYDNAADIPVLEDNTFATLDSFTINGDGAIVLEYTFQNNIIIDELVEETKYFGDKYLERIIPFANHTFNINGINKGTQGEAVLRLGMGREHGKSLQPTVKVNGFEIEVPENYMGYDQLSRGTWFGVIEIPIPFYYLQNDNVVTVQFPDNGGHISSIGMRVYNQSATPVRSDNVAVSSLTIEPTTKDLAIGTTYQLTPTILPINATNHNLIWVSSDNNIATVDDYGNVNAVALGTVTITATADNGLTATSTINVLNSVMPVMSNNLEVIPATFQIGPGGLVQLQTMITPIDADDKSITWTVLNPAIATVDNDGLVTGVWEGTTGIIAMTNDGTNLTDTSFITVAVEFATFVQCTFLPSTIESDTSFSVSVDHSTGYPSNVLVELRDANDNVVANGSSLVSAGLNTEIVTLSSVTAPAYGSGYSLHVFIENTVNDSIVATCIKENVSVIPPSNTVQLLEFAGMQIYPNPTYGELVLEIPAIKGEVMVTVFDLNGRLLKQQTITETLSHIDLSQSAAGMYLMKIQNEEGSITKRIVVQ